ncbi:DUF927 domain-containing protein [Salmonella enterica]|nr:DUF927 domain-containing protein [Salmonella enterica]EBR0107767.1 hypothetical protein [Salmonella enterica subsp. houtenae serovar Houten]EBB6669045.1 DUF927 domain-containing protein [Salmonella enterica]EBB6983920.1 DUF927 domain-containing protein [Salmonella enterica]EBB9332101.1 DUF927 domain-containing protein [Salmonella enterica]EBC0974592.1 DUF927 domain-containing protein [Salmonella enterica]
MSALDNVKHWMKTNYPAACAGFSIPCEHSSKEHECPLCGKVKFRVRMTGATTGTYICTCGVKGCGFGILDLIARKELGAPSDERVSGSLIRQAAKLVDERLGLGFFAADDSYVPPTAEQRATQERERKEALEQRQRESAELEAQQISAAAPRVRDVLDKAKPSESAYLKAKGFENCVLPVTARGDGVLRLTDIDNRDRSVQYLPAPNAVDNEGQPRHKSLMKNAPISGAFIDVQPNDKANTLIITEGYATARSVSTCAPLSRVVAAISASNLKNVATAFRDRFPALEIVIAADNDYHAPSDVDANGKPKPNTGLVKANEAAKAVGGLVVAPLCLGRKKHDWDDVRMELGAERMTEEFNRDMEKARKEKASGQEALSDTTQNNRVDNNPMPWDSNTANVTAGKSPANLPVASVLRIPATVNIAKFRIPDHFKKYYSDKVTPQDQQPDGTEYLVEREDGSIALVNPTTGRGDDGKSGVFKLAKTSEVIRGIRPALRGYKDDEAYITFESLTNKSRRVSVPWASDAKQLAKALRSMGASVVVDGALIDFYRNAYLVEQALPTAVYGSAPGWHEHNGNKFYVSQSGKTYMASNVRFEFDRAIDGKYKVPTMGSIKDYQTNVLGLTKGNHGLIFQVLLELASVLFPIRNGSIKAEGITVNIYGQSGKGKTLAMRLGASVWGNPSNLTESANATYTALVNSAVNSSGGAMRIDDLSAMGNIRGSDFENLIYSIGNGKGKLRSAIDGKNMPADEFSVICIMTAEKTITEEVWQKEGYRFKAGAEARLIEQPFIEPEDLKGNSDIRGFASALMDAVNNAYGEAGAEWLRTLGSLGWSSIQIQLREHTKSFEDKMNSDYAAAMNLRPGHKIRAHTLYSVVYAAGIMSRAITGYSEEEIFTAVASNMAQEMLSNDMGGKRDAEAIEAFWDYLTGSINRMGAIAREGNKATAQRGGDESAGWIDMIDAGRGDECKTVFYLTKRQLNCAARDVCGMSGGELLSLLNKRNYHETPTDARGERDGTVQAWVRSGTSSSRTRLIKITQPPEDIEA